MPRYLTRVHGLTPRQIELVKLIAQGIRTTVIAERMGVSQQTVKHHLSTVYDISGAQTRTELMAWAIRKGFVTIERDACV